MKVIIIWLWMLWVNIYRKTQGTTEPGHYLIEINFSAGCLRFGMQKNNMVFHGFPNVFLKESRDQW